MTTRCETPICGAARPAPSSDAMVSFMSPTRAWSSAVSNPSTGLAFSRRTGCPMRNTSRTAMFLHQPGKDRAHLPHAALDDLGDVLHRDAVRARAAPRRRVHDHRDRGVGQLDLAGE